MLIRSVLFDLDGTLTDPKPGITRSCAHALERLGRGPVDPDSLAWCIGPPLRQSLARMLKTEDPALVESALAHYRERFSEVGLFENEVYDGIPQVLGTLQRQGLRLFVATSKPHLFADRIVRHFGLDTYFEGVVGSELDGTRDSKAEVIAHVLSTYGVDPTQAVMIGDRQHDVIGAQAHGMPCIGVLYGYGLPGELSDAGAWPLCETPSDIPGALSSLQRSGVMPNTSIS